MNLGFFCPTMAVSWRITSFQKIGWNPYFIVFLGARFLCQGVKKRQFLDTLSKKRKFWLITEKLFFWYFCVFTFSLFVLVFLGFFCVFFVLFFCFLCFVFLEGLRVRWGGPKGHLTWPLNPPYFFVFVICCFGGFKGQVRWPKGPPHLALNPPYFLFVFFGFCFFFALLSLFFL